MRSLVLTTSDDKSLAADLAPSTTQPALGAVVLCHPHPLFGGNRFNPVVDGLFRALPKAGFTALRFDFRSEHDDGIAEQLDIVAALDALIVLGEHPPLFVAGYSFGALVALATDDPRTAGLVAIAPPLSNQHQPPSAPALVLTPRYDQYCPPETAALVTAGWTGVELDVVESADHFLHGQSGTVAAKVTDWLMRRRYARGDDNESTTS